MTNKYYIMLADTPWAGPTAKVVKGPDIMVNDGVYLDNFKEGFEIHLSVDDEAEDANEFQPCDIHGPARTLMFSKRFIEILISLGVDNIQYFDADVTYLPTGAKYPHKVSNIVGVVSGLDMDQSEVLLSPRGNVIEIDRMKLDEDKLKGHKIVRLQESVSLIIVHESIKKAVEDAGLTGFLFLSDDEYEPGLI
ncbi:MAG: hypothetical protein JXK07_16095 [Spirochaetes bacterium]|nr:hypothetical protein [Spirochaetota bacterium]MBN2771997.1 hypothetical protein [Spirochaetota bacterium]